jgi:trimeric autotransporter adhesin
MIRKLYLAVLCALLVLGWSSALAAQVVVSPDPIEFGAVALDSPSFPFQIFVSNTSVSAVTITGITISGADSSDFVLANPICTGTIPGGSFCEMLMTFTPSAMGNLTASMSVTVNGVSSPIVVPLTGSGGNPIPAITSFAPASVYVGSSATTITIKGSGFLSSSLVFSNNSQTPLTTTFVSATELKAQIPASFLSNETTLDLYVTNPAPGGGASQETQLPVVALEPTINSISPASIVAGSASSPITIAGSNFMSGATVQWNGVNIPTTYTNSGQLQAQPTAADLATAGIIQLSVTNPAPGTISPSTIFNVTYPATVTVLDLPANDLIWDPFAQRIYASLPSSYGTNGNSIAVINPTTGTVTGFFNAGSEPNRLALSATSSFLYVGLNGNGSVQRLDLPGFTKDIEVNLGTEENSGPLIAGDLKVSPSNADIFAVALAEQNECCAGEGLVFYNNSTKLANAVSSVPIAQILFPTASTVYGYENGLVSEVAVTSSGGTLTTDWDGFVFGTAVQYANGLIYGGDGQVFNPATGLLTGTFDVETGCCNSSTLISPDSSISRAFALGTGTPFFNPLGITSYNLTEFTPVAITSLADLGANGIDTNNPTFIQWGSDGLAFILQTGCCPTESTQVVLVQSPSLFLTAAKTANPAPVVKSLSPSATPHGGRNFILTVRGSNFVPGSTVTWNGKSVFASYVSDTQLHVYVPEADISSSGPADVLVKNPEPGGGKSPAFVFTVN